ncbi:MAG: hypothetical protein K0T53_03485, partial [Wolbachia pipientis]|nr:hypothetical protein [Wolbachia pipientis]
MQRIFIYTIITLFLFILIGYSGFWYVSGCKIKNLLAETILYINDEKSDPSYNFSGFPSSLIFYITNPKLSNKQFTISSDALSIKNRLFDKLIYIYIPNNKVSITIHNSKKKNIKCYTNNNYFILKLNNLPFSLRFNKNSNIIDYIDTLRYEDYGLKCNTLPDFKNQQSIMTKINGKSNYIQLHLNNEPSGNNKLEFDFYIYQYKNATNPENYLSIDTKFNYEFINYISAAKINFNIKKFLIKSNNFSFTADGKISNYNLITSSFKDKINITILN